MVSESQRREMIQKMAIILRAMKSCSSIKEISVLTNIPTSTIQRYLNRADLYQELYQELSNEGLLKQENVSKAIEYTKGWLESSKKNGLRRGGLTSQERHSYQKTKEGKFNGNNYTR